MRETSFMTFEEEKGQKGRRVEGEENGKRRRRTAFFQIDFQEEWLRADARTDTR